ncbi:hypothetical protein PHET_02935 [Paragonimus heterotremus]|uniref:Uncharacterized protein n=1 Tax=Paragonimus heterotremus TaxID=100268 RepID=A0A8J4TKH0_9TREM|nr:hypothetical protein PHET_02935 [Paragonimus heterotremus]
MDFTPPEDLSSPELRRGGSFYSEQLISNLESLHLECARNLGEISDIQFSPIEHVYIPPSFNISTETTSSTPDGQSTDFLNHQNINFGSQNAVVLNVICEEEERGLHSPSQENALLDNQLLKKKEQISLKSEGCVTPNQMNQARKFKRAHHSHLNSPPTHWTRTPVAVCDCDKPTAGALTHSIVPASLTPLLMSAKDDNSPQLLTPRCDLNRLTTLEVPMSSVNRKTPEGSADVVARSLSKKRQQDHKPKKSVLDPRAQEVREWIAKVVGEEREQN